MAYPDPEGAVDRLLAAITSENPIACFVDHQQTAHTLWRVQNPEWIDAVQIAMCGKPLIIVDGHHRYEAALQYRREQPHCAGASRIMMTFVNLYSPGLRTLAAHRMVAELESFDADGLVRLATPIGSVDDLKGRWATTPAGRVGFGLALRGGLWRLELDLPEGALNLTVLHQRLLNDVLGITPDAINRQQFVTYCRGIDSAITQVETGAAQAAFLVEPLRVEQVARLALSGATLPQKSTDFYPKLASGVTIYRLDD